VAAGLPYSGVALPSGAGGCPARASGEGYKILRAPRCHVMYR
jgi:hypothetical protein